MVVARHAEVAGIANVPAELNLVVAQNFCPVVDKLELIFLFHQGAVATIYSQTIAEVAEAAALTDCASILPVSAGASNEIRRLTGGEVIAGVQARDADVLRRCCTHTVGYDVDVISHIPEAEVGENRRTQSIVESTGNTLITTL